MSLGASSLGASGLGAAGGSSAPCDFLDEIYALKLHRPITTAHLFFQPCADTGGSEPPPPAGQELEPALLDLSMQFFEPGFTIYVDGDSLINMVATMYEPYAVIDGQVIYGPAPLDLGTTFHTPDVDLHSAPGLLDGSTTFSTPAVGLRVAPDLLDLSATLHAPSVEAFTVATGVLSEGTRELIPAIRSGSIVGLALLSNEAVTAGTVKAVVVVDGTPTLEVTMTSGTGAEATVAAGTWPFTAGAEIGVEIHTSTTPAAYAPTTSDLTVMVEVGT